MTLRHSVTFDIGAKARPAGIAMVAAVVAIALAVIVPGAVRASHQDVNTFLGCDYEGGVIVDGGTDAEAHTTHNACALWLHANLYYWTGSSYVLATPGGQCYGPTHSICTVEHSTQSYAYGYSQIEVYYDGMTLQSPTLETFYPHSN